MLEMAEAKELNMTPTIPTDMQTILKRFVKISRRKYDPLKLNLFFYEQVLTGKDSEQSKQIEELQKQNEELTDEKGTLIRRNCEDPSRHRKVVVKVTLLRLLITTHWCNV
ncbi:hypothetical protein NC651_023405 [Populus alba x Populus x berolinensis]|nr:hypothetical protein NC651_023405 [Populus alba x Populus x berolinensis]